MRSWALSLRAWRISARSLTVALGGTRAIWVVSSWALTAELLTGVVSPFVRGFGWLTLFYVSIRTFSEP